MRYKQVENHENYIIFENGDIYSLYNNIFLKQHRTGSFGYVGVDLNNKTNKIHRLVAHAFIPNPKNKKEVNHKNFIKNDNRVKNLEWCTKKENVEHAVRNHITGMGKLTKTEIKEIRKKYIPYKVSTYDLAKEYDVCHVSIWKVIKNKSWRFVS